MSLHDYNTEHRGGAIFHRTLARFNLAEILKNIGIGWLWLVVVGSLTMLSLALANGGRVTVYPELLTIGLLASPGFVLLLAGLLMDGMRVGQQQGARTAEAVGEVPPGDAR